MSEESLLDDVKVLNLGASCTFQIFKSLYTKFSDYNIATRPFLTNKERKQMQRLLQSTAPYTPIRLPAIHIEGL